MTAWFNTNTGIITINMLEANKSAAIKFGIDTHLIEEKTDTQKSIKILIEKEGSHEPKNRKSTKIKFYLEPMNIFELMKAEIYENMKRIWIYYFRRE